MRGGKRRGAGRKPPQGGRRYGRYTVRTNDDEQAIIDEAARLDGVNPSTWLREAGLKAARRKLLADT